MFNTKVFAGSPVRFLNAKQKEDNHLEDLRRDVVARADLLVHVLRATFKVPTRER